MSVGFSQNWTILVSGIEFFPLEDEIYLYSTELLAWWQMVRARSSSLHDLHMSICC